MVPFPREWRTRPSADSGLNMIMLHLLVLGGNLVLIIRTARHLLTRKLGVTNP